MDDNPPICPEWWPDLIWKLHLPGILPPHTDPPNPVNYPVGIQDIMAGLSIHTMSYLLLDQKAAQAIRTSVEQHVAHTVQNLSRYHEEAMNRKA